MFSVMQKFLILLMKKIAPYLRVRFHTQRGVYQELGELFQVMKGSVMCIIRVYVC